MAIPVGQFTRKQIIDRALRKVGNTALGTSPDYEAQLWLNQILFDIYSQYDWPFCRGTVTDQLLTGNSFSVTTAAYITAAGAGFLRPAHDVAMVVTAINGLPQGALVREVDRRQFEIVTALNATVTGTIPEIFCVYQEAGIVKVYPTVSTSVTFSLTYFFMPATIAIDTTGDSSIPLFPWADYLIQCVFATALDYEMDGRASTEMIKKEAMLTKILKIAFPSRSGEPTIPLDTQIFGSPFRNEVEWPSR